MSGTTVLAVVGPTAVGKSALAVEAAARIGAEIVSVDSMQVYRGLDAGTDKPSAEMRRRVVHHLIDSYPVSHELTVAEFQAAARAAIDDIAARGRVPMLVGGSGLYFRAVVDDLRFPPRAPAVRRALHERARSEGGRALHAELARLDPGAAAGIEPDNERRIVRALEAIQLTGRRFSEERTWASYRSVYDLRAAGLDLERAALARRIEERVDGMLAAGLVDEARRLGPSLGATARQAVGYRQVLEAPPGANEDDVRAAIVAATKRLARRQRSWFRADPRVRWFDAGDEDVVGSARSYLLAARAGRHAGAG